MNLEEISAEKSEIQTDLWSLEKCYKRPGTQLERDLWRPIYSHYKKMRDLIRVQYYEVI